MTKSTQQHKCSVMLWNVRIFPLDRKDQILSWNWCDKGRCPLVVCFSFFFFCLSRIFYSLCRIYHITLSEYWRYEEYISSSFFLSLSTNVLVISMIAFLDITKETEALPLILTQYMNFQGVEGLEPANRTDPFSMSSVCQVPSAIDHEIPVLRGNLCLCFLCNDSDSKSF